MSLITNPEIKQDVGVIVDCFACADGGSSFIRFGRAMNHLSDLNDGGDEAAQELILLVRRFRTLVEAVTK